MELSIFKRMLSRHQIRWPHVLMTFLLASVTSLIYAMAVHVHRLNRSMAVYTLQVVNDEEYHASALKLIKTGIVAKECSAKFRSRHFMTMDIWPGRTGNCLFELFTLLATAEEYCYTPVFKENAPLHLETIFNIEFVRSVYITTLSWNIFSEIACYKYSPKINYLDTNFNWTLREYFESWKYFYNQKKFLKSIIRFKHEITNPVKAFLKKKQFMNSTKICVHVRRGDMTTNYYNHLGYQTADFGFLKKAMNHYKEKLRKENIRFVIVSDDVAWCKDNLKGDDIYFSPFSMSGSMESIGHDLALLSMSDHVIITGGTFGWIGAWLGEGTVVYNGGFPRTGSYIDSLMNREDYYPPSWIEIK